MYGCALALNLGERKGPQRDKELTNLRRSVRKALTLSPRSPCALTLRGIVFGLDGELENALAKYDEALAVNPDNFYTRLQRARVLMAKRRFTEAEEELERARAFVRENRLKADEATVLRGLGILRERQDQLAAARRYYEEAIAVWDRHQGAHFALGRCLIRHGRIQEGIEKLEKAIALAQNHRYYRCLAEAYLEKGDLPLAAKKAEAGIALVEDNPRLYEILGSVKERQGEFDEAIRNLCRCLRLDPQRGSAQKSLLRLLEGHPPPAGSKVGDLRVTIEERVSEDPSLETFLQALDAVMRTDSEHPRGR
jgi:superkiller protein 3